MSQKNIIGLVVAVLVVAGIVFLGLRMRKEQGYSVVYMNTGEIFVGKLKTFPDFRLTDGYIYQVTKDTADPAKTNFQLNPLKDALWAPKAIYLIKDNVAFYGPLMSDSKIAQTLAGQTK